MMERRIFVAILVILTLIEIKSEDDFDRVPLSKSLAYAVKANPKSSPQAQNAVKDLAKDYQVLYHEITKASKESVEKMEAEEANLVEVVGKERAALLRNGLISRRRSIKGALSQRGRHERSQAARRERLFNQSLINHQRHVQASAKLEPQPGASGAKE